MASKCLVDEYSYDMGMLAPSMIIILVLGFMKKRVKLKPDLLNGRPGLPMPVDFLGKERNKLIIILAFGATASSCFVMFFQTLYPDLPMSSASKNFPKTPYIKELVGIWMTILYGIINYPYLACLHAEYKAIGYIIGFMYAFIRCIVNLVLYLGCSVDEQTRHTYKQLGLSYFLYLDILLHLPSVVCTILLCGSYAVLLFRHLKKNYSRPSTCHDIFLNIREQDESVAEDIDKKHVVMLLENRLHKKRVARDNEPWYVTLKHKIYESRPDFKFSTQFLSAVFVSLIFVYQLTLIFNLIITVLKKAYAAKPKKTINDYIMVELFDYLTAAFLLGGLVAAAQLCMFLRRHRSDVLKTYQTRRGLLPDEYINPKTLVIECLSFCGCQIGFTAIGYLVVSISIFFLLSPIWLCQLADMVYGRELLLKILKHHFLLLLPLLLSPLLIWISLVLLCKFVFCDRTYPDLTVTIDNRRFYDIMSYFFFFLNILVGLWSGLSRVAKGAVLGVVFLCRLDRTLMMKGYWTWDTGYMSYLGFLNVLVAFRHPVMLCFCQILIEERRKVYAAYPTRERPRVSATALNRWFLAVLLIRNPSLVRYRKHEMSRVNRGYSPDPTDTAAIVLEEANMPIERLKSVNVY